MAQEEIYGTRNKSYSAWHRRKSIVRFVGDEDVARSMSLIDIDVIYFMECEDRTFEPLFLCEVAVDVGKDHKPSTALRKLASRCVHETPAYVVLYTLSDKLNPAVNVGKDGPVRDIDSFRVRRVWPPSDDDWRTFTPEEWADTLLQIRGYAIDNLKRRTGQRATPEYMAERLRCIYSDKELRLIAQSITS